MQKVSYMGDGTTTEFQFNFPYFETSNIIVTKNNQDATGYNVIGNSGGIDADIPYTGGKVVFETAPSTLDSITIARKLPLSRIVDYQLLAKINPTTLNKDMNYMMEVLKDFQDELDGLKSQYSDIADKESTATLLARISAIHNEIVALGDISTIHGDIANLKNANNFSDTGKAAICDMGIPDYSGTRVVMGTTSDVWQTATATGILHINLTTNDQISWITVYLGTQSNNITSTTQINSDSRGCDVFYPIKSGQSFKPSPRGATINHCEIIPLCA